MKDSEVGEQWKDWMQALRYAEGDSIETKIAMDVLGLIRKLVEERANRRWNIACEQKYEYACHDFGIPVEEWKE